MSSNHTANYSLSQWERTDKVLMEDFNADNAKIDAALRAEADVRSAQVSVLNAALNTKGNCSIGLLTYTGTGEFGEEHPTVIRFPRLPTAFIIAGNGMMIGHGGAERASLLYARGYTYTESCSPTWSGSPLSFHKAKPAQEQLNGNGAVYWVIYLCAES